MQYQQQLLNALLGGGADALSALSAGIENPADVGRAVFMRDSDAAERNRNERDRLIAETDWWASSDLTMTAEQTAYRQALRDITTHANWPHLSEDDWPTKP